MNTKKTIRKILFVAMWIAIGSGMLTLLIAAIGKQKRETCKDYAIVIKGQRSSDFFFDKESIGKSLKAIAKGSIKGQPKSDFNLEQMERKLEKNVWIKTARLYFDNQAVLQVSVEEREPVARIFTANGQTFYIDDQAKSLPLSDKVVTKVPVFTGFPDKKKLAKSDSVLLNDVDSIAQYISAHSFWSSQVAQVNIVPGTMPGSWEFEMVPVVGNHIVKLGDGENIPQKFNRLFSFYQQVLTSSGLDKYKTIDVRFAGQVVAAKSENPKVDSVKLRRNVEALLEQINIVSKENEEEAADTVIPANRPVDPKPAAARAPRAVMPARN